jgi:type I site-specific restriction endonuclease
MPTKKSFLTSKLPVSVALIERRIYLIRGKKVMLSNDLADLYQVEVRALVQAVKRNIERFPEDFMFQLDQKEYESLKSQFVISSWGGARRARPYAFTEQGVAMLSSVLRSKRAIEVNIAIMRAFVKLRELLESNEELNRKFTAVIRKLAEHDKYFTVVFKELKKLTDQPVPPRRKIGFKTDEDKQT